MLFPEFEKISRSLLFLKEVERIWGFPSILLLKKFERISEVPRAFFKEFERISGDPSAFFRI